MMSDDLFPSTVSVSELNALAKHLLENQLSGLWVAGEISNLTRAASGHYYFSLKDGSAQVRCVVFKNVAAKYSPALQEGSQIELSGNIGIYEARGEFQITVSHIRLTGLGKLYEAYEQLKAQLQNEGLFDEERKQALPAHPQAIGIVTSLAAAALRDVVSTLQRRAPDIPVIVYPTAVQGAGSEQQIAQAIALAAQRHEVDVLIVCRGGGSIEDLWAFNEEIVVRAIADCPLPIVSGVGHETDFTLSDFAADLRAPTPTAAAELVSPNRAALLYQVAQLQNRLHHTLTQHYHRASQQTDWLAAQLRHPQQRLQQLQQHLQQLQTTLYHHQQQNLNQARQQLQQQSLLLDALSPQHILARGFSVVKNSRGQIIRDASTLKQGQKLHILFAEGQADVRVTGEQAQPDLFDFS